MLKVIVISHGPLAEALMTSAIWPQVTNFLLRFVPTFIAVFFGARYINAFMDSLPALVLTTMNVVGGILPAVGIAILLKQIIKNYSMLIYFLVGFICIVFLKLNMVALVIVGALLALIHYNYKTEPQVASAQAGPQADDEDEF
ncbi:PTS system mannose-specific EIIC component [Serratia fonticola]|nr:PTS sugar transporter subunit IIC [Serratia fonticola]CAI1162920.1 PTS system mannose-specific EIIC component [Serratia fonticola]